MDIAGKGLAGALLAIVAAPIAVLSDAVSFLLAALLVRRVRTESVAGGTQEAVRGRLGSLARHLLKRAELWCLIGIAAVNGLTESVFMLYCIQDLKASPSLVAALLSLGAVGGVAGGMLVGRLVGRIGTQVSVLIGILVTIWAIAPLPFARPGITATLAIVNLELAGAFGGTIALASVFADIQGSAEPTAIARTMAVSNNLLQIAALAGLAAGGLVGSLTSVHFTIVVCAVAIVVFTLVPFAFDRRARAA